jgi:hypothetical protein
MKTLSSVQNSLMTKGSMHAWKGMEIAMSDSEHPITPLRQEHATEGRIATLAADCVHFADVFATARVLDEQVTWESKGVAAEEEAERYLFSAYQALKDSIDRLQTEAYAEGRKDEREAWAPVLAALRDLELGANTVDACYTRNPGNFAAALRDLRDYAEKARTAIEAATTRATPRSQPDRMKRKLNSGTKENPNEHRA